MIVKFNCPHCSVELTAESADRGHTADCTECGQEFTVPLQGTLEPGNIINDLQVISLLGEGAMGKVFLAKHLLMDRSVAIKTIKPQARLDGSTVDSFLKELKTMARLHHPNIITTYDAGYVEGVLYVSMQYVDGADLDEIIQDNGPMTEKAVLQMARSIADSLDYAWSEFRMIHRDIKPENIKKTLRGHYILMDFGIALATQEDAEAQKFIVGTPDFMSPEQARASRDIDARSDIYSLGLVMLYLLTGRRPFVGDPMQVIQMQQTVDPASIAQLNPSIQVHAETERALRKMFAKDPDERYQTWAEVIREIDSLSTLWQTNTMKTRMRLEGVGLEQLRSEVRPVTTLPASRPRKNDRANAISRKAKVKAARQRRGGSVGATAGIILMVVILLASLIAIGMMINK